MSDFLKIPDVAKRLGLRPARTYQLAQLGYLPCVRRGRAVFVPRQAFELWLAAQNATAQASVQPAKEVANAVAS